MRTPFGLCLTSLIVLGCSDVGVTFPALPADGGTVSMDAADRVPIDAAAPAEIDATMAPDLALPVPTANRRSPIGTNLSRVADWTGVWPFIDAFHTSRPWFSGTPNTWQDNRPVDVDASGWVKSLQPGQWARTLLFWGGSYPAGRYIVRYRGSGTLAYGFGATRNAGLSAPGRDVLDVDPNRGGIAIYLTATDANDPLREISVIMPGGSCQGDAFTYCSADADCGGASCVPFESSYQRQPFHPLFLSLLRPFRLIRFKDWMATDQAASLAQWSDRPLVTDASWAPRGVPLEIQLQLANTLHADAWFSQHHLASDDYITRFATQVRDGLGPDLKAYIEHSNEVWNGIFASAAYCQREGLALQLGNDPYQSQIRFHSRRSVHLFRLWKAAFGAAGDRVVRVMGSHSGNAWTSEQELLFENAAAETDAVAIGPYFGYYLGLPANQVSTDAMTLDDLFAELAKNAVPRALGEMQAHALIAAKYKVALVAYEGGQHLWEQQAVQKDAAINKLFDAANRDPRMKIIYSQWLDGWKAAGGQLLVHFTDCARMDPSWGRFGMVESLDQPRAAAPKYQALADWMALHDAWW